MFENYFKIAIRNLYRHGFYSFINILGLAIGMTAFIIITLWVRDELSYDKHFKQAGQIYRIQNALITSGEPNPMAEADPRIPQHLLAEYPEVEQATVMHHQPSLLSYGANDIYEENTFYADSGFFKVFSFDFLYKDHSVALRHKDAVILGEKMARKLFGNKDPIGQTVYLSNNRTKDTARPKIVTGILKASTKKSHFDPQVVLTKVHGMDNFEFVYVRFKKDFDPKQFRDRIWPQLYNKHFKEEYAVDGQALSMTMHALGDIHLDSHYYDEIEPGGNRMYVYVFSITGLFILIISVVNYMNLATARSYNRAREVGVRKVIGSSRRQLVALFLTESLSLTFIALLFALAFTELLLPVFNNFAGKTIAFHLFDPATIGAMVALALAVGLVSGSYPALFISSFTPIKALKGKDDALNNMSVLRKSLVVFQFTLSIIMIIATMIVTRQLDFVRNTDLGFKKEQVLTVELKDPTMSYKKAETFKTELLKCPDILKVAGSTNIPGGYLNHMYYFIERPTGVEPTLMTTLLVDYDYLDLMGFKLMEGKKFDRNMVARLDSDNFVIANESAVRFLGWKDHPLGRQVHTGRMIGNNSVVHRKGICIGTVKDFHASSLHEAIGPTFLTLSKRRWTWMSIKISGKNIQQTIAYVKRTYRDFCGLYPFEYSFLDEHFNRQYEEEEKSNILFTCFSGLCIFISCLGLMGLASFTTRQRTKEIGVRKISGAGVASIVYLFSKDFIRLVLIALVIAIPIAAYAMNEWLSNFAYRTPINWLVFMAAGGIAIITALVTISFHIVRAANQDLATVLKHE
jgi:putative ABC transport system permease protein